MLKNLENLSRDLLKHFVEHNENAKDINLEKWLDIASKTLSLEILDFSKKEKPLFVILYRKFGEEENFGVFSLMPAFQTIMQIIERENKEEDIEIYQRLLFREIYGRVIDAIILLGLNKHRVIIPFEGQIEKSLPQILEKASTSLATSINLAIARKIFLNHIKKN